MKKIKLITFVLPILSLFVLLCATNLANAQQQIELSTEEIQQMTPAQFEKYNNYLIENGQTPVEKDKAKSHTNTTTNSTITQTLSYEDAFPQSYIRAPQQIKAEPVLIGGLKQMQQNENKVVSYNTPGKPAFTDEDKTILKAKMGVDHNKKYGGDFSPDAIAYLKSINFPFLIETGNYLQDKQNHNKMLELWKEDNKESLDAIQMKIDQLNKNYNKKN